MNENVSCACTPFKHLQFIIAICHLAQLLISVNILGDKTFLCPHYNVSATIKNKTLCNLIVRGSENLAAKNLENIELWPWKTLNELEPWMVATLFGWPNLVNVQYLEYMMYGWGRCKRVSERPSQGIENLPLPWGLKQLHLLSINSAKLQKHISVEFPSLHFSLGPSTRDLLKNHNF